MSELFHGLPNSWCQAPLEVLVIVNPSASSIDLPKSDDALVNFVPMSAVLPDARGIDTTGSRQYGEVRKGYTAFTTGDVLFAKITPCMENGKSALVPVLHYGLGFGSTEFHVLRPRSGVAHKWISHFVGQEEFRRVARRHMTGTAGQLRVPTPWLNTVEVPLAPAAEQIRIVAKLEELLSDHDAGVAELKAAQAKLAQYRQSLLKAAVDGSLTAEWRKKSKPKESGAQLLERILAERRKRWEEKQLDKFREQGKTPPKGWENAYPQPVKPDTTNLPELPEGWVWATLDQLTESITSGSRGWAEYYAEQGAVFIRSQNINKDRLDLDDIAFVDPPRGSEGARTRVRKHDLLLTITGANVGKVATVEVDLDEAYVSQHVSLIRPIDHAACSYLHAYLTTKSGGRGQLDKAAYGAGKPGLNLTQVGSVSIPIPSMDEIRQIMSDLDENLQAISNQSDVISATLAASSAQRKNILKAAFSGQLVPQDPSDEPASVLLERIRAERVASVAKSAKRGRKGKAEAA